MSEEGHRVFGHVRAREVPTWTFTEALGEVALASMADEALQVGAAFLRMSFYVVVWV